MDSMAMNEGKFNYACSVLLSRCICLVGLFWTIILLSFTILSSHPPWAQFVGKGKGGKPINPGTTGYKNGILIFKWAQAYVPPTFCWPSSEVLQAKHSHIVPFTPSNTLALSNHLLTPMSRMLLCYGSPFNFSFKFALIYLCKLVDIYVPMNGDC